ncbi:hypothetical protein [Brevibacillus sp. SYSU BS000544]
MYKKIFNWSALVTPFFSLALLVIDNAEKISTLKWFVGVPNLPEELKNK